MSTAITPFTVAIADSQIADLQRRLAAARLPGEIAGAGWSQGPTEAFVAANLDRLRNGYDWRKAEAGINAHPQFTTEIDGQRFHFLHVRSSTPNATPLLLLHGWPGSFVEFLDAIDLLTDQFDLVIPSLPGFGFSGPTRDAGWNDRRISAALLELMSRIGYQRFGVQGGDAGAMIAPEIARQAPDRVIGVHVSAATVGFVPFGPVDADVEAAFTDNELVRLRRLQQFMAERLGFNAIQSSRPQALAYGLVDSPAGLLAWMSELFTNFGDAPDAIDRDTFLTNFLVYWFTGTAGSSIRLYYENAHDPQAWAPKANSGVPTAVAVFQKADVALRVFGEHGNTITRWTEIEDGGHFAAMEVPALWADDVRAFFKGL
jgi:epoxide hydrolase